MLDELRDRIASFLSQNRVCVVATRGSIGAWAMPARYESKGLELCCYLPRWSDAIFHIEQEPQIIAVVMSCATAPLWWLQYCGIARITDMDDRYVLIHVEPRRIDLLDERQGWGARETLDL